MDVLHVLLEVAGGEVVLLSYFGQRVDSVLPQVVFMGENGLVCGGDALVLDFGQSLQIIVARVDAKSAFVVLQFVGGLEGQQTVITVMLF
jgi:hypothetical protein